MEKISKQELGEMEKNTLNDAVRVIVKHCKKHTDCSEKCHFYHGLTGCNLRLYPYEWLEVDDD